MRDDAELLWRYAHENSQEAFTDFVQRNLSLVYSVALRRVGGDTHLAEEIAQTVFTAAARKASMLARHAAITGWLFTSARYAATAAIRARVRRERREQEANAMSEELGSPETEIAWEQLRPVLDDLLEQLDTNGREAVLLRFYNNCSYAEIGATLRVSEDAARMRVDRALDRLGQLLERRGVQSTTAVLGLALANHAVAVPPALAGHIAGVAIAAGGKLTALTTLLEFMGTTKATTSAAAVALILLATWGTHEVHARRQADAALTAAQVDFRVVTQQLQQEGAFAIAADARVGETLKTADESYGGAASVDTDSRPRNAGSKATDPLKLGQAFLDRHPEVRQALVERAHARIKARYASYYKLWKLTPTQIQQFETLMQEREGLGVFSEEDNAMMQLPAGTGMAREEVDRRVQALLGDEVYGRFKEANDVNHTREYLAQLASALYATDTPLTAQQAQQLDAIVADRPKGAESAVKWAVGLAKARTILSPAQYAVIDDLMKEQALQRALSDALRRANTPVSSTAKP